MGLKTSTTPKETAAEGAAKENFPRLKKFMRNGSTKLKNFARDVKNPNESYKRVIGVVTSWRAVVFLVVTPAMAAIAEKFGPEIAHFAAHHTYSTPYLTSSAELLVKLPLQIGWERGLSHLPWGYRKLEEQKEEIVTNLVDALHKLKVDGPDMQTSDHDFNRGINAAERLLRTHLKLNTEGSIAG